MIFSLPITKQLNFLPFLVVFDKNEQGSLKNASMV